MNLYKNLIDTLEVQKGERLWISSELLGMVINWRKAGVKLDGNLLLDAFQEAVGKEGTILIPTFSFDFSNFGHYDYKKTKCSTGALGNLALQRPDFVRTLHPMHNFAVWGKDQKLLTEMTNLHSFGDDSPFGYCLSQNVRQLILNTDYQHAMTFVHYAETKCQVPYRFAKSFTGTYVDADGISTLRTYDYAARKLEIQPVERINRIGHMMEEAGVSKVYYHHGLKHISINLAASWPMLCEDIQKNQCRNIYDFNIPREEIFK